MQYGGDFCIDAARRSEAQTSSGIAGVIRDTSGAVLPGVTVEATSPALIEKARVVVSDTQGLYNIVDLRPGTYAVTFSLSGFSTLRREGIQLTVGFTAQVDAELQVGALEETITVAGASPLVDTQNVRQQTVVTEELLETLPTTRSLQTLAAITPGLTAAADVGGTSGIRASNNTGGYHGKNGTTTVSFDDPFSSQFSLSTFSIP